jgi:hypothetical protein
MVHEDRLLFLKQFTKELILQSKPPEPEKLPKAGKLIKVPVPKEPEKKEEEKKEEEYKPSIKAEEAKPTPPLTPTMAPLPTPAPKQVGRVRLVSPIKPTMIAPPTRPLPPEFNLGKIDALIRDPRVTLIESPGSGKIVLVRMDGTTTTTQISLSQEEIHSIIQKFAEQARIPIVPGIFKAVVGNLLITAGISELVGTRFIISKITTASPTQTKK